MQGFHFVSTTGGMQHSDALPGPFIQLPGEALQLASYENSVWALIDFKRPWWAFWRKRGLHWHRVSHG